MNEEIMYCMGFSHCYGIGPLKFNKLLQYFGSVEQAYNASFTALGQVLGLALASRFIEFRKRFDLKKKLDECKKKDISIVCLHDLTYPALLKQISDPPICLYIRGDLKLINFKQILFGIVGTRTPTSYGQQVAQQFAYELAQLGFIIVSGLALGIDTIAHQSAIAAGSKTIGVLGCGVDIAYPASNKDLYTKIIQDSGVVISEFPHGMLVQKGLFVARNRIISGLSRGILVVEGAKDSGALITAKYAAEQGRDVFAPPVPITSLMSQAPSFLLKQGAKFVTESNDILQDFGMNKVYLNKKKIDCLSDEQKNIVNLLIHEPLSTDEIVLQSHKPLGSLFNILSCLEMEGVIEKNNEGKYQLCFMSE